MPAFVRLFRPGADGRSTAARRSLSLSLPLCGAQELKEFLEGDFRANIELKTINRWDVGSVESSDTYLSCATQPFASQADLSQDVQAVLQQTQQQPPLARPRFLQGVRTKARFDPVDATRALQPDTIELPRPEPQVFVPSASARASPFAKGAHLYASPLLFSLRMTPLQAAASMTSLSAGGSSRAREETRICVALSPSSVPSKKIGPVSPRGGLE